MLMTSYLVDPLKMKLSIYTQHPRRSFMKEDSIWESFWPIPNPFKRETNLVSLIGRFYDPLGFLSPVVIRFKILFQRLCQCKSDWGNVIAEGLIEEWRGLISDFNEAQPMSLPRSYLYNITDPLTSSTLYGFCNASTKAFAAVVCLLLRTKAHSVVRFRCC